MRRRGLLLVMIGALGVGACQRDPATREAAATASGTAAAAPAPAAPAARPRVVALGDSLTAGLGLAPDVAWPALVQQKIAAAGLDAEVVNAGVSGDTTAGGLRRLDWALDGDVKVLVIELGANDGLRGLPVDQMRDNLSQMIRMAKGRGITVLLLGMEAPPNFGPQYTREFRDAFVTVATEHDVAFIPFMLAGVAGDTALNQADGIHPNEEGTRRVADLIWHSLKPLLTRALATT
ncbi:Esterase TesA precursor [Luteitalea pratensis]|uniref:Esterase TesA n=1 Tax=Luteitalea pratensis TaxID=1855912 RepID=A0A143PQQ6_LUTPR|nr:arylesterase [Luteitalea pratensis]AMY11037.1 Esterase TesA precursor [Luteitalea pratensis]